MLKFKSMLLSFLQRMFTSISFLFYFAEYLRKIELFSKNWYFFSNCCLRYCVVVWLSTVQQVLSVKTFYKNGECAIQTRDGQNTIIVCSTLPKTNIECKYLL